MRLTTYFSVQKVVFLKCNISHAKTSKLSKMGPYSSKWSQIVQNGQNYQKLSKKSCQKWSKAV